MAAMAICTGTEGGRKGTKSIWGDPDIMGTQAACRTLGSLCWVTGGREADGGAGRSRINA